MIDTDKKNNELFEVCKKLKYNQRIIFSNEGNLNTVKDILSRTEILETDSKPDGLWYSFGPSWIKFLSNGYEGFLDGWGNKDRWEYQRVSLYSHVYKLSLHRRNILSIKDEKSFDSFHKKYSNFHRDAIKWSKVAKEYAGIEIRYLSEKDEDEHIKWYKHWDCSSGCIWDASAVRSIRVIKAWEKRWKSL